MNPLRRWRSAFDKFIDSRQLQFDVDVYRCAALALLHQRVEPALAEQQLLSMRPHGHYQLAHKYYVSETQRLLNRVYADTRGLGVPNVYPPELPSMSSAAAAAAPRGDAVMNQRRAASAGLAGKRAAAVETRSHAHPDGFRLVVRRSSILHDEAGYGVFVDGAVRAGQLLALYAGLVIAPPELSAEIVSANDYLVSFYSGWVIDGREWFRRGTHFDERLASVVDAGMTPPASALATLRYRNPLALGSLVNHVPHGAVPNVVFCELEINASDLEAPVAALLPNDALPPSSVTSRFVWHEADGGKKRTIALVALRDIEPDSELFLNYRLNPANKYPEWYWQPDEEAASRRWRRPSLFSL